MKAPRLALGGSGDDFSKLSLVFLVCCLENVPPVLPPAISPMLVEPKRQRKTENLPRSCRVTARLPRIARLHILVFKKKINIRAQDGPARYLAGGLEAVPLPPESRFGPFVLLQNRLSGHLPRRSSQSLQGVSWTSLGRSWALLGRLLGASWLVVGVRDIPNLEFGSLHN